MTLDDFNLVEYRDSIIYSRTSVEEFQTQELQWERPQQTPS